MFGFSGWVGLGLRCFFVLGTGFLRSDVRGGRSRARSSSLLIYFDLFMYFGIFMFFGILL